MRKILSIVIFLFLAFPLLVLAQTPGARNAERDLREKTNFGNIGVAGSNVYNTPGYIEIQGISSQESWDGTRWTYYLWIDETGDLCIASDQATTPITGYASFPTGDWRAPGVPRCTVVGGQS